MNSAAIKFAKSVERDVASEGSDDAFRMRALCNLKLQSIVRESHQSPVKCLAFNQTDKELENLLASVGGNQAMVYNNRYLESYINVVGQFTNEETTEVPGGELLCCCWMRSDDDIGNPYGDAILAVSGVDKNITILNLVESRATSVLKGHKHPVIELSEPMISPGILVSLSKEGELRLWNRFSSECLLTVDTEGSTMASKGCSVYLGSKKGKVSELRVQFSKGFSVIDSSMEKIDFGGAVSCSFPVECVLALPENRLAIRWGDGAILVWDLRMEVSISKFKVPGCGLGVGGPPCGLGATTDGGIICAGNHSSMIYVFNTWTGAQISRLEIDRIRGAVQRCVVSNDGMHVLGCVGNGFIFRFEYDPKDPNKKGAKEDESSEGQENDKNGNDMEGVQTVN
ncbi:hypothetical protein BSKO_12933 [Bryopsis sp. KO-2023]|nr:hypothetical protein BSKO_12933 [Bryopsis sp. KO-2023]